MAYLVSFFFVLSLEDWFVIWMGLEMNMMSFVGMGCGSNKGVEVESLYKYFFVQSIGSALFLVMMYVGGMVGVVLSLKIGGGPFYFWFPSVMGGMTWILGFFLMTFQKVLPLFLISGFGGVEMWFIGVISLVVGVLGSFNQVDLSKLMAYSSLGHVGWLLVGVMLGEYYWIVYFLIYVVLVFFVVLCLLSFGMKSLGDSSEGGGFVFVVLLLNLSGMPPFLGFLAKVLVLEEVIEVDWMVSVILVLSSVVMFYVYVRMGYNELVGGGSWMSLSDDFLFVWVFLFLNLFGVFFYSFACMI